MFVSAIVLAAGEATRLGGRKMLLPWGESTILETVTGAVAAAGVNETVVVLGHRAGEIAPRLAAPLKTIFNPRYREGMSTSIIAGIGALSPEAGAAMLVLGDQPRIGTAVISRILEEYRGCGRGIAVPVHRGRRGHPVIISLKYRDELLALKGDTGAREIIARHGEDVLEVAVGSGEIFLDVDTEEDYRPPA